MMIFTTSHTPSKPLRIIIQIAGVTYAVQSTVGKALDGFNLGHVTDVPEFMAHFPEGLTGSGIDRSFFNPDLIG